MIAFDQPSFLLAVPLLALVVVWLERRLAGSTARRVARAGVRTLVLALAVGALAGPHTTGSVEQPRRLVVALDRSPRLPATAASEAEAVLALAETAAHASGVATTRAPFHGDAGAGLAQARLALRSGESGGILVVTDGHGDLGGLQATARALEAEGLAVTAAAVPAVVPQTRPEPRIGALDAPDQARGPFGVRVALEGPVAADARVVLRVDGSPVQTVAQGAETAREVRFEALDLAPGLHELAVTLEDPGGRVQVHARRLVEVGKPPRVVFLMDAASASPWRKALSAQGLEVVDAAPQALGDLLTDARALPDLVVADAATLRRAAAEALSLLAARVRDGLGLLVEPGRDGTAWAPLADSPLGPLLPLRPRPEPKPPPAKAPEPEPPRPDPPRELEPPEPDEGPGLKAERKPEEALPITLLLLVDRSPSMRVNGKMAMAILGAQAAASALSPWDRIGVITFADDVTVDVSPRSARGAASIPLLLSTVRAGGKGTNIAGALKKARAVLERERSPILHVILLTDGRQHPPGPIFGPIVKPMRRRGITITAVGIGAGSRMDQLREIVQWAASGMVIRASTARDIPVVLTRDTREVAAKRSAEARRIDARVRKKDDPRPPRPPEKEQPPRPPVEPLQPPETKREPRPAPAAERLPLRLLRAHEALAGVDAGALPQVGPPRRVAPAAGAAVLLARTDGMPVLAAGRAGLGRVLQWTLPPDDAGALGWQPLGAFMAQAARAVMAPRGAFGYLPTARVHQGPDGAHVRVEWPQGTTTGALDVRWHGPEGKTAAVGRFSAEEGTATRALPDAAPGSLCRLELGIPEGPTLPAVSYLVAERTEPQPRPADARALAAALGGALVDPAQFARALPLRHRVVRHERWPLLLWIAIGLLPLDVFLHRRRSSS